MIRSTTDILVYRCYISLFNRLYIQKRGRFWWKKISPKFDMYFDADVWVRHNAPSYKQLVKVSNTCIEYTTTDLVRHRDDGPAVEWTNGKIEWWIHGKRHRIDGPAVMTLDGRNLWYVNGNDISEEICPWAKEMSIDLDNLTEDDKSVISLMWGNI